MVFYVCITKRNCIIFLAQSAAAVGALQAGEAECLGLVKIRLTQFITLPPAPPPTPAAAPSIPVSVFILREAEPLSEC